MLEDFSNTALAEAVKALDGVADLLASLRTAQDDFNAASDSPTAALTAKGESAYALKKPLLAAINEKLVPYVSAMSAIQSQEKVHHNHKKGLYSSKNLFHPYRYNNTLQKKIIAFTFIIP